jgi:hypothetical protein
LFFSRYARLIYNHTVLGEKVLMVILILCPLYLYFFNWWLGAPKNPIELVKSFRFNLFGVFVFMIIDPLLFWAIYRTAKKRQYDL